MTNQIILSVPGSALGQNMTVRPVSRRFSREEIEAFAGQFAHLPPIEAPLTHFFQPGVYVRQVVMPAGSFIIGKCHKTEHLNVIQNGKLKVIVGDFLYDINGPCVLSSGEGINKILLIEEETSWITIHQNPSNLRDIEELEGMLVFPMNTIGELPSGVNPFTELLAA